MKTLIAIGTAALLGAACSSGSAETRGTTVSANTPTRPEGSNEAMEGGANGTTALHVLRGQVGGVGADRITVQGVTLTVDSRTQIVRSGVPVAEGISAIREGDQVRASYDPMQNRAMQIEISPIGSTEQTGTVPQSMPPPPSDATKAPNN